MTVATAQTQKADKTTQGRLALWKPKKESTSTVLVGKLSVTPAMLRKALQEQPDGYGNIKLDVMIFRGEPSENENAPQYTGFCRINQDKPKPQDSGGRYDDF